MSSAARRYEERERRSGAHYQLELGGKSLLALFFALAIVCGMFFAFGYTLGKHAIPATFSLGSGAASNLPETNTEAANNAGVQPPNPAELGQAENNQTPAALTPAGAAASPAPGAGSSAADAGSGANTAAGAAPGSPAAGAATAAGAAAAGAPAPGAAAAPGQSVYHVQVFAGVKADAESLAAALQQRGYPVSVVPPSAGESDLFRVQVGPYLTIDEAKAMRSRLTADGYQAIVK